MSALIRLIIFSLACLAPLSLAAATVEEKQQDKPGRLSDYATKHISLDTCGECHEEHTEQISHKISAQTGMVTAQDCETCHGSGEIHIRNINEGETELGDLVVFSGTQTSTVATQNESCLQCHQGDDRIHWQASAHESEDLACTSCHVVHKSSQVLERTSQAEVCYQCHKDIRAQAYRASSHPIREGKVVCSDCHNPHGSAGPAALKQLSINENCYTCHAELRGPFLWEHFPATEDCTLCHKVHGSNHPALLARRGPQLCQQCHADVRAIDGRTHVRVFLDFDLNDPDPTRGNARGRLVVGENCMNCHSQVHGSNHPSGANLQR